MGLLPYYFEFEWRPINDSSMVHVVQTDKRELMDKFLFQHGFKDQADRVRIVYDDKMESCSELTEYKFGSKKRDKLYTVVSNEDIIAPIVEEVGFLLASVLSLGACALMGDIEIFSRINSLVEELDFVYVSETSAMVESMTDYEKQIYTKSGYPYYEDLAMDVNSDDSWLMEQLYAASCPQKEYQAITLESYVKYFTEIFIMGRVIKDGNKETGGSN